MKNDPTLFHLKSTRFGYDIDLLGNTHEVTWDRNCRDLVIADLSETDARKLVLYLQAVDQMALAASSAADPPHRPATPPIPPHELLPTVRPAPYAPVNPGAVEVRSTTSEAGVGDPQASGGLLARADATLAKLKDSGELVRPTEEQLADLANIVANPQVEVERVRRTAAEVQAERATRKAKRKSRPKPKVEAEAGSKIHDISVPMLLRSKEAEAKADNKSDVTAAEAGAAMADAVKPVIDALETRLGDVGGEDLPKVSPAQKVDLQDKIADLTSKNDAVRAAQEVGDDPLARFKSVVRTGARGKDAPPRLNEFSLTTSDMVHGCPVVQACIDQIGGEPMWVGVLSDGATVLYDLDGVEKDYIPAEPDEPGEAVLPPEEPTVGLDSSKFFAEFPEDAPDSEKASNTSNSPAKPENTTTVDSSDDPWVLEIEGADSIPLPDDIRDSPKVNSVVSWLMSQDPRHKAAEKGADRDRMVEQLTVIAPILKSLARTKPGRISNRVDNTLTILGAR